MAISGILLRVSALGALLPDASAALSAAPVPTVTLPGGDKMPMAGLGLCCRPSAEGDAVRQSVFEFLMLGGRHLDDAELYTNHQEVGLGIRQAIAQGVPRSEIFVTTKISANFFGFEKANAWVPHMLNELGLEYVDLVLLHWAGKDDDYCGTPQQCRLETWLALQRYKHSGHIRNLGVSNFGPRQMGEIMALRGAPIANSQIEFHPWVDAINRETVEFCHQNGISVTAYGSMGSDRGASQIISQFQDLGEQVGRPAGQVLLRWAVQKNITVIPGTGNPAHMKENLDIFNFELGKEAMTYLDSLSQGQTFSLFSHVPDKVP